MSGFPTFRLPFLATKHVINQMDLRDLTALFLCSKKTREFIKTLHKRVSFAALSIDQKKSLNILEIFEIYREGKLAAKFLAENIISVNLKVSDDIGFQLNVQFNKRFQEYLYFHIYAECIDQQDQYKGTRRNLKIGDVEVPGVMTDKDVIYTFWDSKQKGFEKIGKYLKKITPRIFNLDIDSGMEQEKEYSENLRFVINWMNSTNRILQQCTINDAQLSKKDIKFILNNVHPTEDYNIWTELGDQFQYNSIFKSRNLCVSPANWFTLRNLFMTDCQSIHLSESNFTNSDLNEYLKHWMEGKFPKLESLYVKMQENMKKHIIFAGLKRNCIIKKDFSIQIKRDDGLVAQISKSKSAGTKKTFKMKILRINYNF